MAGIDGASGSGPVHRQQQIAADEAKSDNKVSTGKGILKPDTSYSFKSADDGTAPAPGRDGRLPLASPDASNAGYLGSMTPDSLEAVISGLRSDSDELKLDAQAENIKDDQATRTRNRNEARQKAIDMLESRENAQQDTGCNVAQVVIGAVLGPAGAPLLASGIRGLSESDSHVDVNAVNADIQNYQLEYFGEDGNQKVNDFLHKYNEEFTEDGFVKAAREVRGEAPPTEAKDALDEMLSTGVITEEMHAELSDMMHRNVETKELHAVFLGEAISHHKVENEPMGHSAGSPRPDTVGATAQATKGEGVDQAAQHTKTDDVSNKDFNKWLAQLTREMEEQDEAMAEVQEQFQDAKTLILNGGDDQKTLKAMLNSNTPV